MALHHVNFHTLYRKPVFEHDPYDQAMRRCIQSALRKHKILCPAWEVMPTHVHMIVADFDDRQLPKVVQAIKGNTSHAFLAAFPELRGDLLGGHLWTKGYYAAGIVTHRQFIATIEYIRLNRTRDGLEPPAPLTAY